MADETENQPAPTSVRGPAAVASVRWSTPALSAEFKEVVEYRKKKGKSKGDSDFIEQMFNYVKNNPYSDFPTGR